jgi:WD40 repeat protein
VQCLTQAHSSEIFSIAITPTLAVTASGESALKLWDAKSQEHPLVYTFSNAHPLGAHHVVVDIENGGTTAASSGFGQELVIWDLIAAKEKVRLSPGNDILPTRLIQEHMRSRTWMVSSFLV